jgi:predicted ribosomally synthesized peptide with SipW-like signal peptide
MKKRIFLSLTIVAVVGGLGFAATRAFFTARVKSTDSQFTVGTLDLTVDGAQQTAAEKFIVEGIGASGDIKAEKVWNIKNTGSLPGKLYFKLENMNNLENGCNQAEKNLEPACADDTKGELGNVMPVHIYLDGVEMATSLLTDAEVNTNNTIGKLWTTKSDTETTVIQPGATRVVKMAWNVGQDAYDNKIQSDSLSFDTVFDLEQLVAVTPTGNR